MQNINFVIVLTYCTINTINGGVSRSRTIAAAGRPDEGDRWQEIRGGEHMNSMKDQVARGFLRSFG